MVKDTLSLPAEICFMHLASCPACGRSASFKTLYRFRDFNVLYCQCGHRFINPALDEKSQMLIYQSSEMLRKVNPVLVHYYEYDTSQPGSVTYRERSHILDGVEALTSGRTLLEVGCGAGSFLRLAHERGWEVWGIDSGAENIRKIQSSGMHGICCNFMDFQSDKKFDCIVLLDLIEHTPYPKAFAERCRELMKTGGLLVIATPSYPNLLTVMGDLLYRVSFGRLDSVVKKLYILEHTSYFNLQTLEIVLQRSGFKVLKAWKVETDLDRYRFPYAIKLTIRFLFLMARFLGMQNRLNLIAQK